MVSPALGAARSTESGDRMPLQLRLRRRPFRGSSSAPRVEQRARFSNSGGWKESGPPDIARGRGVGLMRALMSELEIFAEPARTTVRMRIDVCPLGCRLSMVRTRKAEMLPARRRRPGTRWTDFLRRTGPAVKKARACVAARTCTSGVCRPRTTDRPRAAPHATARPPTVRTSQKSVLRPLTASKLRRWRSGHSPVPTR